MTKLSKPVTRETAEFERTVAIVVTLHPRYMELRLKGDRNSVPLTYGAAIDLARKVAARRASIQR